MPLRESREKAGKVQICEPGYLPVLCDQKLPFKASTQIRRIYQSGLLTCTCGAGFFLFYRKLYSVKQKCSARMPFMGFRTILFYVLWRYTNEKENKMDSNAADRSNADGTDECICG